jgi:predicted alpha/beta-hydrolase family hydrolase
VPNIIPVCGLGDDRDHPYTKRFAARAHTLGWRVVAFSLLALRLQRRPRPQGRRRPHPRAGPGVAARRRGVERGRAPADPLPAGGRRLHAARGGGDPMQHATIANSNSRCLL